MGPFSTFCTRKYANTSQPLHFARSRSGKWDRNEAIFFLHTRNSCHSICFNTHSTICSTTQKDLGEKAKDLEGNIKENSTIGNIRQRLCVRAEDIAAPPLKIERVKKISTAQEKATKLFTPREISEQTYIQLDMVLNYFKGLLILRDKQDLNINP